MKPVIDFTGVVQIHKSNDVALNTCFLNKKIFFKRTCRKNREMKQLLAFSSLVTLFWASLNWTANGNELSRTCDLANVVLTPDKILSFGYTQKWMDMR